MRDLAAASLGTSHPYYRAAATYRKNLEPNLVAKFRARGVAPELYFSEKIRKHFRKDAQKSLRQLLEWAGVDLFDDTV